MLEKQQCRSVLGDSNFVPANDLKSKPIFKKSTKTNISFLEVKMRFQGNCMSDVELGT